MNIKFKDLPKEILEKCRENTILQGGIFNIEADVASSISHGGFHWDSSPEGSFFWGNVLSNKKYNIFYERYPQLKTEITNFVNSNSTKIYYGTYKDKRIKITIEYEE